MRLVFVNHAHPGLPHVSGLRVSRFAQELAQRGHQVLLLTSTRPDDTSDSITVEALATRLGTHDWARPLHVAVAPRPRALLSAARAGRLPAPLRRAVTLWNLLVHGGMDEDWASSCAPHLEAIASGWRPDLVWATFGALSNLTLAQRLAHRANAPWLIDFKDPWSEFVHPWLRRRLALRFQDAVAATSNSEFVRDNALRWFGSLGFSTVYSGVDPAFMARERAGERAEPREFLLIGSVYRGDMLGRFLEVFAEWLASLSPEARRAVRFGYQGGDSARVAAALQRTPLDCEVAIAGHGPLAALAARCRDAVANCYVAHGSGFHHKTLELLAAGRPVICFPRDLPEAEALAAALPGRLRSVAEPEALAAAFQTAWQMRAEPPSEAAPAGWSWAARAAELERVLQIAAPQARS